MVGEREYVEQHDMDNRWYSGYRGWGLHKGDHFVDNFRNVFCRSDCRNGIIMEVCWKI